MRNIGRKATKQWFDWRVFFQCFHYFKKVAMETVRYLQSYNFLVPASCSFWILRFLAFIWYMMPLVLPPAGVHPKIWSFAATLISQTYRLIKCWYAIKGQFWKFNCYLFQTLSQTLLFCYSLNPSAADVTFVECTKKPKIYEIFSNLSCWYSL